MCKLKWIIVTTHQTDVENGFKPCTTCVFTINKRNKMPNTNKTPGKAENKSNTDQRPVSYGQNVCFQKSRFI